MTRYRTSTLSALALAATASGVLTAAPAFAGGVGDFLSPAFGTACANHRVHPGASGSTTAGTGTADGNLLALPVGGPLNQCGGADLPLQRRARFVGLDFDARDSLIYFSDVLQDVVYGVGTGT